MKKAFTLVEVMIVIVIVGVLACMAIPAYVSIKSNHIAKRIYCGLNVTDEERIYVREHIQSVEAKYLTQPAEMQRGPLVIPEATTPERIVINGKKYKLVPE